MCFYLMRQTHQTLLTSNRHSLCPGKYCATNQGLQNIFLVHSANFLVQIIHILELNACNYYINKLKLNYFIDAGRLNILKTSYKSFIKADLK
jgi:hypothetical protein